MKIAVVFALIFAVAFAAAPPRRNRFQGRQANNESKDETFEITISNYKELIPKMPKCNSNYKINTTEDKDTNTILVALLKAGVNGLDCKNTVLENNGFGDASGLGIKVDMGDLLSGTDSTGFFNSRRRSGMAQRFRLMRHY